jgi:flagellar hook-length control protein FliK
VGADGGPAGMAGAQIGDAGSRSRATIAGAAAAGTSAGAAQGVTTPGVTTPGVTTPGVTTPGASAAVGGAARGATKVSSSASTTNGNAGGNSNTDATTSAGASNADPAGQTAAMAAMAASAAGATADDSAADADATLVAADGLAAPAAGAKTADAAAPNVASVPALAAASREAAAAAASVPAVSMLTNTGATDKHSRDAGGDSLLSGGVADGAAGLAQVSSGATVNVDSTQSPTPTLKVTPGVETSEFGQGVADRVSWMVDNNLNGAKLQVNPAQLGPIEVRIAVQGGHAQVWMTSHSAVTRDALESSSGKLREMLGAQGFGQVSVDISQRSFQDRSPQAQTYDWTPSADRNSAAAPVGSTLSSVARTSSGALDAYA